MALAETTPPTTFDPTQAGDIATWYAWPLAYDSLIRVRGAEFEPMLATEWEASPDGLTYTFQLREGVKFHNGEVLSPDDVVFSFERMLETGIPYVKARFPTLESIEAEGDMGVRFTLSGADAGFLNNLGDPFEVGAAILNEKAATETDPATKMVGTGPYKMTNYVPDQQLTLVRNEDYWGEKAATENLKILYMPDQAAQTAALRAGQVDLMFPSAESVRALESGDVEVKEVLTSGVIYLEFNNVHNPALADLRVRKAIALAIDREAIVKNALLGAGEPSGHLPPDLPYAIPPKELPNYSYDPDQARSLLAEAGHADGLQLTLDIFSTAPPHILRYVEVLQSQLKDVGIDAKIVNGDFASWLAKLQSGEFDILGNYASYKADPIFYLKLRPVQGGEPPAEIAAMEAKVQAAKQEDVAGLLAEYEVLQAEHVFPNLGIATQKQWIAVRPGVGGVEIDNTMSRSFLANVTVQE